MKNIVYSTTRQWNPGDEFILFGTQYLLEKALGKHNSIIYNRHPQIRRARKVDIVKSIDNLIGKDVIEKFLDNSIKERPELDFADLVVFAGSPEWRGKRLEKLYSSIKEYKTPSIFLGLGTSGPFTFSSEHFTNVEMDVLQNAKFVSCRDNLCAQSLKALNPVQLPCPALFSSPVHKKIEKVKKIALIYGTNQAVRNNKVSDETYAFLTQSYQAILENFSADYEIEFIAHYIDELPNFRKAFPDQIVRYSYDAKEYREIFAEFDLVIGHRVHGIGMCASLGIPGIMISHTPRADTVRGFLAKMVNTDISPKEFISVIENEITNIADRNKALIEHKQETEKKYLSKLIKLIA